jgi:hypothetical protein
MRLGIRKIRAVRTCPVGLLLLTAIVSTLTAVPAVADGARTHEVKLVPGQEWKIPCGVTYSFGPGPNPIVYELSAESSNPQVAAVRKALLGPDIVAGEAGTAVVTVTLSRPRGPNEDAKRETSQHFVFVNVAPLIFELTPGVAGISYHVYGETDWFSGRIVQLQVPKGGQRPYAFPDAFWLRIQAIRPLHPEIASARRAGRRLVEIGGRELGTAIIEVDVPRRSSGEVETTWIQVEVVAAVAGDEAPGTSAGASDEDERDVTVKAGGDVRLPVEVDWASLDGMRGDRGRELFEVADTSVAQVTSVQLHYDGNGPRATGIRSMTIHGSKAGHSTTATLEYWSVNWRDRAVPDRLTINIEVEPTQVGANFGSPPGGQTQRASLLAALESMRNSGSHESQSIYVPQPGRDGRGDVPQPEGFSLNRDRRPGRRPVAPMETTPPTAPVPAMATNPPLVSPAPMAAVPPIAPAPPAPSANAAPAEPPGGGEAPAQASGSGADEPATSPFDGRGLRAAKPDRRRTSYPILPVE